MMIDEFSITKRLLILPASRVSRLWNRSNSSAWLLDDSPRYHPKLVSCCPLESKTITLAVVTP